MNTYEVSLFAKTIRIIAASYYVDDAGNLHLDGEGRPVASFAMGCWASILVVTPATDCDSPPNLSQEGLSILEKTGMVTRTT